MHTHLYFLANITPAMPIEAKKNILKEGQISLSFSKFKICCECYFSIFQHILVLNRPLWNNLDLQVKSFMEIYDFSLIFLALQFKVQLDSWGKTGYFSSPRWTCFSALFYVANNFRWNLRFIWFFFFFNREFTWKPISKKNMTIVPQNFFYIQKDMS